MQKVFRLHLLIARRCITKFSFQPSLNYFKSYSKKQLITNGAVSAFSFCILQAAKKEHTFNMETVQKAEALYEKNDFKGVYEYLLQFKSSEDPELLWRLVRATRDRACMPDVSKEEKKTLIFEAFEYAKKALQFGEENFACHKWYGIMLSQTGDYIGTKKKLEDSPAMKQHFEKAIQLNPNDATSRHLIGMWCFSFADLAWYERKIATVVFGTPPSSTYEEALQNFEKAEELSPSFYSTNQYMLGLAYLRLGNKAKAKEWFQKVCEFQVVKEEDKENIQKAKDQLKSL
ncbi:regulator of microtubule dynamics protein 1 isoform X1 [Hydra vulgaris]|uniref:regulator of microtubule dynamics protein 1 isoform X1 n=2 Tax=Hydra vulgaris TaxID=6087 RepID=UPI001F5FD2FB|nr:regulator of microtubule dynamics protein 1 isoform X1 [Hydra vulgaris]